MEEWTCALPGCDIVFKRYRSSVRNPKSVYCSLAHKAEDQKTLLKGIANPNYRHGNHVDPQLCECGREKDYRAKQCAICAKVSFSISGEKLYEADSILQAIVNSRSYIEVANKIGASRHAITKFVVKNKIDISHFRGARDRVTPPEKIFCLHTTRSTLPRKWLKEHESENVFCAECGIIDTWNDKPINIQLHHINGNGCDDRKENLQWLCPNCYSQTENYVGHKRKGV